MFTVDLLHVVQHPIAVDYFRQFLVLVLVLVG